MIFFPGNTVRQLVLLTVFAALCIGGANAKEIQIVALGTSFTAGKGVSPSDAFPARLEKMLRADGENVQVSNRGINGNTTRDILDRIRYAVPEDVQIVIYEYARGNDNKRGINPEETVKNTEEIISDLVARKIQVLLVIRGRNSTQLQAHMNWFREIVSRYGILSLAIEQPESSLQRDRQHPTAEAHGLIAATMVGPVKQLIERTRAGSRVDIPAR